MVATQADVASIGSRLTRRERRTRKRRAHLSNSIRTTPRESAFTVLWMLISVKEVVGRTARWGVQEGVIVLLALLAFTAEKGRIRVAGPSRDALAVVMRVAAKGFGRDALLFVGLLGSGLAALGYLVAGKTSLAMLFCLLAVLMCVGLWIRDEIGGAE